MSWERIEQMVNGQSTGQQQQVEWCPRIQSCGKEGREEALYKRLQMQPRSTVIEFEFSLVDMQCGVVCQCQTPIHILDGQPWNVGQIVLFPRWGILMALVILLTSLPSDNDDMFCLTDMSISASYISPLFQSEFVVPRQGLKLKKFWFWCLKLTYMLVLLYKGTFWSGGVFSLEYLFDIWDS